MSGADRHRLQRCAGHAGRHLGRRLADVRSGSCVRDCPRGVVRNLPSRRGSRSSGAPPADRQSIACRDHLACSCIGSTAEADPLTESDPWYCKVCRTDRRLGVTCGAAAQDWRTIAGWRDVVSACTSW
jgi:hypothetical protein